MTKHTITIDIDHGALIDQCAKWVLAKYDAEYDDDGELIDDGQRHKQIDQVIRQTVISTVRKRLDEAITAVTNEHITTAVKSIMEEGWQKTNSYGEPTGPKVTLKDRVSELLTSVRDSYSRKSWIDELVEKHVAAVYERDFKVAIEETRAKFRALLDGKIAASVQDALKSALGLR